MIRSAMVLLMVFAGCAHQDWPRNLYEGVRQQQQVEHGAGSAEPAPPPPDYDQYRRERDKLKSPPPSTER